ncbi:hypothetical protein QAD02_016642 [Eretmocerus hayati]|uniref:Uncharacterized protein n=1 Tax=Eretmocerus hayati TaxID=131215 RepID=A0ACC2PBR6_9HYME|nr:hypothetical protein QAD02_016642 [Eretmocerus hayati]
MPVAGIPACSNFSENLSIFPLFSIKGQLLSSYLVFLVELILSITRRQQSFEIWDSLQVFDESFELLLDYDIPPSKTEYQGSSIYKLMAIELRNWLWGASAIGSFGWAIVSISGAIAFNDEPYLHNITYMLPSVLSSLIILKFWCIGFLINQRLDMLMNFSLKELKRNPRKTIHTRKKEKIQKIFSQLVSASISFGNGYSWSLLLMLFNISYHLLIHSYLGIAWFYRGINITDKSQHSLCEISWSLMYLLQLLAVHSICGSISQKVDQMAYVLLEWQRQLYILKRAKVDLEIIVPLDELVLIIFIDKHIHITTQHPTLTQPGDNVSDLGS